jgi:hypothetical protein
MRHKVLCIASLILIFSAMDTHGQEALFHMEQIEDALTLETEIIVDWHTVGGEIPTRQKYMTIRVGELWPGQDYRVPVRLVVPHDRKASGFHLTGDNRMQDLEKDLTPGPIDRELIEEGVGLVLTMVQNPGMLGQKELGEEMNRRFLETLDPHFSIQYWGWPATLMRAVTAAYAESDHFEQGKVAVSGASKNGASASVALICDHRITAQHSTRAPIWDSPLRMCDRDAWDRLEKEYQADHFFLGGTFGPIYNKDALEAGHSWEDLQKLAQRVADQIFISRNLDQLAGRKVDMLFHPGTHDYVAFDLPWGGAHFPRIPVYLEANTGHGYSSGLPPGDRQQRNLHAFLLDHFFKNTDPLLRSPSLTYAIKDSTLKVTVSFEPGSGENSGRIFWMFDRAPEGSTAYLQELFPEDQWKEMAREEGSWTAEIALPGEAASIDFFSTHGKEIYRKRRAYQTYLSSPYTRAKIRDID